MIDIERIKQRVFEDAAARQRIVRDYGFGRVPESADELVAMLQAHFGQHPSEDPLRESFPNEVVFRAAVKTIGSNSRARASFFRNEPRIAELLNGYDPLATHRAVLAGRLRPEDLQAFFPGQSSPGEARATLRWARTLSEVPEYYEFLRQVGGIFQHLADRHLQRPLCRFELALCVVGYLGFPPGRWEGDALMPRRMDPRHLKAPGMGYLLASEFLRNLGWHSFKPDRHLQRLLDRWSPGAAREALPAARELMTLIGRSDRPLRTYLTYSLAGRQLAPPGLPLSHVDNLVWLLGAYVEKKGRESATAYLQDRAA